MHYLVKLTDEAYRSTDAGKATTVITFEYTKAFDLVDHNVFVEKLVQFRVRGKLINLIISFLRNRRNYNSIKEKNI